MRSDVNGIYKRDLFGWLYIYANNGRLTYLWNGYEHEYGKYDFENNKKIGE